MQERTKPQSRMPILFIIGSGRCGSSLVHEIVARNRNAGFISNIEDNLSVLNLKGRFNNALLRSPIGRYTKKGRIRFAPSEAYHLIARQVSPMYGQLRRNPTRDDVTPFLRDRFERLFAERYVAQGKPVFVHKYTGWSRAAFFHEIFPEARFVHIVRDGRAVASSFLRMPWWTGIQGPPNWMLGPLCEEDRMAWESSGSSLVVLAGLAWKILVASIEHDGQCLDDDRLMTLRYEDFLAEPETRIREISEFGGLGWDADAAAQVQKSPIRSDSAAAWKRDLTAAQVDLLEQSIRDPLTRYGYE